MQIERKFSFSLSRLSCFEFCRRAYFYRYIFSWGGWEEAADPLVRKAYHLKNLSGSKAWLSEIFRRTLRRFIREKTSSGAKPDILLMGRSEFNRAWDEAVSRGPQRLPAGKTRSISELHYGGRVGGTVLRSALADEFRTLLANFAESGFLREYGSIPYLQFRDLAGPESVEIGGVAVYISPDFLVLRGDEVETVNIHAGGFRDIRNWDFAATFSEVLAGSRCKAAKVSCRSVFFAPGELSVWASRPEHEARSLVMEKSAEMISFERECGGDAPLCELQEKCSGCEFRGICLQDPAAMLQSDT